jgi:hypothetical protein
VPDQDLWGTAPQPVNLTYGVSYYAPDNTYEVAIYCHYSKKLEGEKVHTIYLSLEWDERELASALYWTADRYFWKNRPVAHVRRECVKRLIELRTEALTRPANVSGFHEVDFG